MNLDSTISLIIRVLMTLELKFQLKSLDITLSFNSTLDLVMTEISLYSKLRLLCSLAVSITRYLIDPPFVTQIYRMTEFTSDNRVSQLLVDTPLTSPQGGSIKLCLLYTDFLTFEPRSWLL